MAIIKQMSRQVSRGSGGDYQADEQAGVEQLRWRLSSRRAGRCHVVQFLIIKQMSTQVSRGSVFDYQADEQEGSRGSVFDYQADEQAGVAGLSWRLSSR